MTRPPSVAPEADARAGRAARVQAVLATLLDPLMRTVRPRAAVIEATSHCQLRCPSCPTAQRKTDAVLGRGTLTPALLTQVLDTGPRLRHLELSNWGEALLNPKLAAMCVTERAAISTE